MRRNDLIIENLPNGFANHQILTNSSGEPVDYVFLKVNRAFEEATGLEREKIIGQRVKEVIPEIQKDNFDWIGKFGKVALNGEVLKFQKFPITLQSYYEVMAYSEKKVFLLRF